MLTYPFHRSVESQSTFVEILGVGLVFVSTVLSLTLSCVALSRSRRRKESHPPAFYEDEDGQALIATRRYRPDTALIFVHVVCTTANAAFVLVRQLISPTYPIPVQKLLQLLLAIFLIVQSALLCFRVPPPTLYHLGLCSGLSCFVAAAISAREAYDLYDDVLQQSLLCDLQIVVTIIAGFCAWLLQRRPNVFFNDLLVDRQSSCSLLGWLSFSWIFPLLRSSQKHVLVDAHDLPELDHKTRAPNLFAEATAFVSKQETLRLLWTVLRLRAWSLFAQFVLSMASTALAFAPRLALLQILRVLETSRSDPSESARLWLYVAALGTTSILSNVANTWKAWISYNVINTRVYSQLVCMIYEKSTRLSGGVQRKDDTKGGSDAGKTNQSIVNAMATEARGIAAFVGDSYILVETPLKLILCCVILLYLLGWQSVLAGVVVLLLTSPLQRMVVKRIMKAVVTMLSFRDVRMTAASELINGIRQVKFLAAEDVWEERVNELRDREVAATSRTLSYTILVSGLYLTQPILLVVVILAVHTYTQPQLSASTAFTTIAVLSMVEQAMDTVPFLQMRLVNALLFSRRVENFLRQPERTVYIVPSDRINVENATIVPPGCRPLPGMSVTVGLRDVNLQFPQDQLSIVTGPTGTGKSLLLSCLVGEAELVNGTVRAPVGKSVHGSRPVSGDGWLIEGAMAFVPQTAWIETGTIRDNILFGCPYLPDRYQETMFACALHQDLDILSDGDLTMVGGNGANLSGGQKARVALARALYSRAQTLVMDDIFSAVDVHTAKHLNEYALTGSLTKGRTRVLATYMVELCLSHASYLVTMDGQGGCLGTAVTDAQRAEAKHYVPPQAAENLNEVDDEATDDKNHNLTVDDGASMSERRSALSVPSFIPKNSGIGEGDDAPPDPLIGGKDITPMTSVQWSTIWDFAQHSGGLLRVVYLLSLYVIYGALTLGRGYAIRLWTDRDKQHTSGELTDKQYLLIYVLVSATAIAVGTARIQAVLTTGLRGSAAIFRKLLHHVLRARLRWLDTVPIGQLLGRFSADIAVIDMQIAQNLRQLLTFTAGVLTSIASAAVVAPQMLGFGAVLLCLCVACARYYVTTARQLKRIESNASSPLFDHLSSSTAGISTIRAFGREQEYLDGFLVKVGLYSRAFWHLWLLNRWMGFWMNLVGAVFLTITAISMLGISSIDAAAAGLAISFTMQLGQYLVDGVQAYAAFEMDMNSVHRLLQFTNMELENEEGIEVPASWPSRCNLEVSGLMARYAPELPPALHGVTFTIGSNERIGVVGRTGSGKSSLSLALMRFIDLEGSISIDGVDISSIPLHRLRAAVTLIPQSPVLFSGTVRSNLDPANKYDDADLLTALMGVHWRGETVRSSENASDESENQDERTNGNGAILETSTDPDNLERNTEFKGLDPTILQRPVAVGGTNMSLGERQLLCLARAILVRPKILIMDESTSSVDKATDEKVQKSIRSELGKNSTLLVIAHRLRTIADFDRILVMDQGRAAEFGPPAQLMKLEKGLFRSLVEEDAERLALEEIIRAHDRN